MKTSEEVKEGNAFEVPEAVRMTSTETSVGQVLQAAREDRGWSVEVVAGRLKLSAWQIKAIEDNYWDVFSHPSSLRGFIRNYAKLLGLDDSPLLEALNDYTKNRAVPIEEVAKTMSAPLPKYNDRAWMSDSQGRWGGKRFLFLIVLLAALGVTYAVFMDDVQSWWKNTFTQSAANLTAQEQEVAPDTAATNENATQPSSASNDQSVSVSLNLDSPVVDNTPDTPAETAVSMQEETSLMSAANEQISPKVLQMNATGSLWVEVRSSNGAKLHTFYLKPGDTVKAPVNVYPLMLVVNNPKALELTWSDAPIELPRMGRSGVSTITLQ